MTEIDDGSAHTRREQLENHPDILDVIEVKKGSWEADEFEPISDDIPPYEYVDLRGKQPAIGRLCEQHVFDNYPIEAYHDDWRDGKDMLFVQDIEVKGARVVKKDGRKTRPGRFICWRDAHEKLEKNNGSYMLVVYQVEMNKDRDGILFSVLGCVRVMAHKIIYLSDEAGRDGFNWNVNTPKQGDGWNAQIRWDWVIDSKIERIFID